MAIRIPHIKWLTRAPRRSDDQRGVGVWAELQTGRVVSNDRVHDGLMSDSAPSELAFTLLVLNELGRLRQRPLQLRDVERAVFRTVAEAVKAGELKPAAFLKYDPPRLFAQVQELRQCDLVTRRLGGYEVTPAGKDQAELWTKSLFSKVAVEHLRKGVRAAA
jgi:hypothetical protein